MIAIKLYLDTTKSAAKILVITIAAAQIYRDSIYNFITLFVSVLFDIRFLACVLDNC